MSFHATNPIGSSRLFPCLVEQAICLLQTSGGAGGFRPPCGGSAWRIGMLESYGFGCELPQPVCR